MKHIEMNAGNLGIGTVTTVSILLFLTGILLQNAIAVTLPTVNPSSGIPYKWDITIGKYKPPAGFDGTNTASKGQLIISSVNSANVVTGTLDSSNIQGKWFENSWQLTFHKIGETKEYTGFLIREPGCSGSPGGNCDYSLAGYYSVPVPSSGPVACIGCVHLWGWYAHVTTINPTN